jgi:hypothetical protein
MPLITINIKVTPNSKFNRIEGVELNEKDQVCLKVKVSAQPQDGKANVAVIKLLSEFYNIPKSYIDISSGWTSRLKTVTIANLSKEEALKNSQIKLI